MGDFGALRYVRESGLSGATVIDIGANKGVFSIYMSRAAGPNGKLIAFEQGRDFLRRSDPGRRRGVGAKTLDIVPGQCCRYLHAYPAILVPE